MPTFLNKKKSCFLCRHAPGLHENVSDRRGSLLWGSHLSGRRSCKSLCVCLPPHLNSHLKSFLQRLTAAHPPPVPGWCHYREHARYPLLILRGPRGGFMHDCSVHSCEEHLSVDAARSANPLRCQSAGVGCGSRFRFDLCIVTVAQSKTSRTTDICLRPKLSEMQPYQTPWLRACELVPLSLW